MPILYDPSTPLKEYLSVYYIPTSMAECIEQYRVDRIQSVDEELTISEDDYQLIGPESDSEYQNILNLYDPLGYYRDTTFSVLPPGPQAYLPPVPSDLINRSVAVSQVAAPHLNRVREKLKSASDKLIIRLAMGVAAAYFDDTFSADAKRDEAVCYLAFNTADNPASRYLSDNREVWEQHRRQIDLPDMVNQRKKDLLDLFKNYGKPLKKYELECVTDQSLFEYANDMRLYILEQNRHLTFCKRCGSRMLLLNSQIMQPTSTVLM
jgi:hypothetical protein